ncbi:hypothetical protein ACFW6T_25480 [Kitasatospora phosalacinea]|uniref:Uncharacterized protein n=2 Tax=Kitasatospora phosalacinea TaxID=2065 RepID=A0ABW6GRG2_9ACTN
MTAIRLAMPAEQRAAQQAEERDPEAGRWSQDQMLLAQIVDVLRIQHFDFLRANGAKGLKPPPPIPRPGGAGSKKPAALTAEGAEVLFNLINGAPA